jgi:thiol-disulfide isomerase/thioredoxin/YHS domain-containing protein
MRVIGKLAGVFALCSILICAANAQSVSDSKAYVELGSVPPSPASPQQSIWQPTLDAARQLAARTDRLVLVYFYADWCQACRVMEEELAAAPNAMGELQQHYVAVKVNADFFPATAKQYGVTGLPTTVVITPQGQAIDGIRGRLELRQYVARLSQVAGEFRRAAAAHAARGWPAAASAGSVGDGAGANRPLTEEARRQYVDPPGAVTAPVSAAASAPFGQQQAQRPAPAGMPSVDPFSRPRSEAPSQRDTPPYSQHDWAGQPPPSHLAASGQPVVPPSAPQGAGWPTRQPATGQMPAAGTASGYRSDAGDSARPTYQPRADSPSFSAASNPGLPATGSAASPSSTTVPGSVYARWTNNWPAPNESRSLPPQSPHNTAGSIPPGATPATGAPPGGLVGPAAGQSQPAGDPQPAASAGNPQISIPPGNPPLGLDGYCPVCLVEKQKWILGNRLWGVIHRGRTYLFDSPEDRAKFFADPDRYAPVMSGQDVVYALESGRLVPGYRRHGVYFGNRVYLFADESSLQKFSQNPHHYAAQALAATRSATSADNLRR